MHHNGQSCGETVPQIDERLNVSSIHILAAPQINGQSPGETVQQIDERLHDAFGTKTGYLIGREQRNIHEVSSR